MTDRVFEDRVGLLVIDPDRGVSRLPAIRSFAGGLIHDVFLPRTATEAHMTAVRKANLNAHLWVATDGLDAGDYVARTLDDIVRLGPGAAELDVELGSDGPLPTYVEAVVRGIRARRPNYRLRVNLAPWKGFAVPDELLAEDPALYVDAQNYLGNMDELVSPADVFDDLLVNGAPRRKATVCYAAACKVLGSPARVRTLPDLTRARRGVIFSDDLMVEAGLL